MFISNLHCVDIAMTPSRIYVDMSGFAVSPELFNISHDCRSFCPMSYTLSLI